MKATIDRDGKIELGNDLQRVLGVKPGDDVILESRGDGILIKKPESGLTVKNNVLVHHGTSVSSIDSVLEQIRDERFQQLCDGLAR